MFFQHQQIQFFKPLTSKYRQQVLSCLVLVYERQFSAGADYGESLHKEQLIELMQEALVNDDWVFQETEDGLRFRNSREKASWILKQLIDCGWIESQVDQATLVTRYPFSRVGRLFAHTLAESTKQNIRTHHRNTRNTLNSLNAFLHQKTVYDILDAYDYSERIVTDFTDLIAELEEQKRELVREVEAQQLVQKATDQFFDFMETRFKPDIAVRLSADSVEKYRDEISLAINKIRKLPKSVKRDAEKKIRQLAPQLTQTKNSFLWHILDTVDERMQNAAEIMLPALRKALHGFTKRADIIIRQLSYLQHQDSDQLIQSLQVLADKEDQYYHAALDRVSEHMASFSFKLIDPEHIKLQPRRLKAQVETVLPEWGEPDQAQQLWIKSQLLTEQAFSINQQVIKSYLARHLSKKEAVSSKDLPIETVQDLLAMNHLIEMANFADAPFSGFSIIPTGKMIKDHPYFKKMDEFLIQPLSS